MKRLIKAFGNSLAGLAVVWREEQAFRQDCLLVCLGAVLLAVLDLSVGIKIGLAFSLGLILIAELINTAIEKVVDRLGTEYNELSKHAKDIGSAIVMMTIGLVIALWVAVLVFVI